jgi:hypothetical protein
MGIRVRTISLDPFFEVIKHEYLPQEYLFDDIWGKLQQGVCRAAGLQNDLIGLERDIDNAEPLNAVVVLMRCHGVAVDVDRWDHNHDVLLARYIEVVSTEHNRSVAQVINLVEDALKDIDEEIGDSVVEVMRHISRLCETHLEWCASAKRYRVKEESRGAPAVQM